VAVSRKKKARRGRPRTLGPKTPPAKPAAPSLPPAPGDETPQVVSTHPEKWTERPPVGHPDRSWWLPDNSTVRPMALNIIARRINGESDEEIATALGISKNSISPYVYRATKNGWLDIGYDPKQRIQFQTMHKVVQELETGLSDGARMNSGMMVKTAVALKIAEGTVFKQFGEAQTEKQGNTVVAVQVIMPDGPRQVIREETTGGVPAYVDAVVEESHAI
jgi:hypothetical protein